MMMTTNRKVLWKVRKRIFWQMALILLMGVWLVGAITLQPGRAFATSAVLIKDIVPGTTSSMSLNWRMAAFMKRPTLINSPEMVCDSQTPTRPVRSAHQHGQV